MRITESQLRRIIREEILREGAHGARGGVGVPHPEYPDFMITTSRRANGKWGYSIRRDNPPFMTGPQTVSDTGRTQPNEEAAFNAAMKHVEDLVMFDQRDEEYRRPEVAAEREAKYQQMMADLGARRGY